jgi:predicted  nucleic acid-binding Zn-ribbon protein
MDEQYSLAQIDEAIRKQQEVVNKVRAKYDDEQKKLKNLEKKREEKALKAIGGAMKKSTKSYEEIIAFIQS